jgi:ubiquinone/menaquinone biosynthesis C-methylase UbiE
MQFDHQKEAVRRFWEAQPCGSVHSSAQEGAPEYFQQVERRRRELEPFIDRFAAFSSVRGQDVLEVGVGLGTDLVRFARAGAHVTGVDLTEHAVQLVRQRLALEGLSGRVEVGDAENLPFADDSFDYVYSWGVLHHTPDPAAAVREAIRVLRPRGRICLMLYARHSWVAYALWLRHALLRGRPDRSLSYVVAHHLESEGTKAFTRAELRRMVEGIAELSIEQVGTSYDGRVGGPLARLTGPHLGWFLVVRGVKPGAGRS